MHKRFLLSACVLSLLTLASCFQSKYPLTSIADAEQDERLVGVWSLEPAAENKVEGLAQLHIGAEATRPLDPMRGGPEKGLMRFVWVAHETANGRRQISSLSARFFVSKIGEVHYANVCGPFEPMDKDFPLEQQAFLFMRYSVEGNLLSVWIADPEPFIKAVKNGDLAGTVERKMRLFEVENVKLTATSEPITAFLKTDEGKKVFADHGDDGKLVFRRLR